MKPQATARRRQALDSAIVSSKGARRWAQGHPWIYRSDVLTRPDAPAGAVIVSDQRGRELGCALWSPTSEIALRLLDRNPRASLDESWWRDRLTAAVARRAPLAERTNAYRLVHGEGDACPSLVCDRYDRWIVVQLMSAGIERFRDRIVAALSALTKPLGILARHDVPLRSKEDLTTMVELLAGDVPREIEVSEHGIRYLAAPWDGQKTGAFLDQRENRVAIGARAHGRALDCFSYHGSFALHLAAGAAHVTALDVSSEALRRGETNAALNGFSNIDFIEANAFEFLKAQQRARERYHTIVLDPPAFAKSRASIPSAVRGYKEINLRAMQLLTTGGMLLTASCSFHLTTPLFLDMLRAAASDSGRRLTLRELRGQPLDHPEILGIPETGYLKSALIEALD
ncbi:MAG TPA: class I SAM-dependent rRNA methyltransferase [Gemmatimonadaceae bacterium]|jgi:23S rRNA (cytosine1962-C5)-methyltransferase